MKMPMFNPPKKKLQATARRMPQRVMEQCDDEPTMKLSTAFVVVLLLHVVAVGGIYAFNSVKAHKAKQSESSYAGEPVGGSMDATSNLKTGTEALAVVAGSKTHTVKAGDTLGKIAAIYGVNADDLEEVNGLRNAGALRVGQELKIPVKVTPKPIEQKKVADTAVKPGKEIAATSHDVGHTYVVAKGDNPVVIAKRLGISYDELLRLNKIEDPKKLQIGQKLILPAKTKIN